MVKKIITHLKKNCFEMSKLYDILQAVEPFLNSIYYTNFNKSI